MAPIIDLEEIPMFQQNFGKFFDFLQAFDTGSSAISPERFALVTNVDLQTLVRNAHVHRNDLKIIPYLFLTMKQQKHWCQRGVPIL